MQAADLMEHRILILDYATGVQCFNIYLAVTVVISKGPEWAKNL